VTRSLRRVNPDHVSIVIHNYRWRLGLAEGEPKYSELEDRLAKVRSSPCRRLPWKVMPMVRHTRIDILQGGRHRTSQHWPDELPHRPVSSANPSSFMVAGAGFEPATFGL
jgi:hypothetical protein